MSYLIPAIPIINKWNKVNKSLYPKTNCTAIVLFNSKLDSTLGIPKITKFIRDLTYLNTRSLAVLVGILLGDAYLKLGGRRHSNNNNVRIAFKQSIINFPFMWAVFTELSHFCSSIPRFDKAYLKSTGKTYGQLILETRTYPIMNVLYTLFIQDGKKVIKEELYFFFISCSFSFLNNVWWCFNSVRVKYLHWWLYIDRCCSSY